MRRALTLILPFLCLALIEAGNDYVTLTLRGHPEPYLWLLLGSLEWWGTWAALAPVCALVVRRFPPGAGWARLALALAVAGVGICAAHLGVAGAAYFATHGHRRVPTLWALLRGFVETFLMLEVSTYLTIAGACVARDLWRRNRDGERRSAALALRAAQAESGAAEARLHALRNELHPHFLFNTLNAVSGLVRRRDHDGALRVLELLGDLLRATLSRGQAAEVPLARELEFLGMYLEIARTRFHDRLEVGVDAPAELLSAPVPPLVLQPLVENAVRHGVARVPGPGRVRVRAAREAGRLLLVVEDSGPGFPIDGPPREGIGLSNTRARLRQLYGAEAELGLETLPAGGARVTLALPLRGGA